MERRWPLAKGYSEARDELEFARGRILPLETARTFYAGRPVVGCEFEEFSEDIALNRVLKAAAHLVASSVELDSTVRQGARAALMRMTDVGALQHGDLRAQVDRLTYRYKDALAFARILLGGGGTTISYGDTDGWCFLVRTPDLVEAGVRSTLKDFLRGRFQVQKLSAPLEGSGMSVNPDLVFERGLAVGDVKYKLLAAEWNRPDLYQSVAFAAAFKTQASCVIGFCDRIHAPMPARVQVGRTAVQPFVWRAAEEVAPVDAAIELCHQVASWLAAAALQAGGMRPESDAYEASTARRALRAGS
jgi:5-methylcytosine-specific restriction enzyme subunit McrC